MYFLRIFATSATSAVFRLNPQMESDLMERVLHKIHKTASGFKGQAIFNSGARTRCGTRHWHSAVSPSQRLVVAGAMTTTFVPIEAKNETNFLIRISWPLGKGRWVMKI